MIKFAAPHACRTCAVSQCRSGLPPPAAVSARAHSWTPRHLPTTAPTPNPAQLTIGDKNYVVPGLRRHHRAGRHRHLRSSTAQAGMFTYDPGFTSTGELRVQDHLHRRRRRHPALSRLPDRAARRERRLPRDLLSPALRRTADQGAEGRLRLSREPSHDGARADEPLLPGLPPRRASDGGDDRLGRRAVGVLSRLHRHLRSDAAHDRLDPHDREDADARRDGLQIFDRPAVRLSAEQPRLRDQLPAHVLRGAGRGVQAEPGAGARDGPHLHPARRPRAERLDLDGAARRLVRRQPVRLHRGRHRLPVGPGAWRRQRSRAEDARPRSARSTASRNTSSARRTRTTASA